MMSENAQQPLNAEPTTSAPQASLTRQKRQLQQALTQIEEALQGLRFGQVTITVQDGVVVQIDRLERKRLHRNSD